MSEQEAVGEENEARYSENEDENNNENAGTEINNNNSHANNNNLNQSSTYYNNSNTNKYNKYLQIDSYDSNPSQNQLEYVPTSNLNSYKNNYNTNFHNNYQTYRSECSKLMSNDAYEPPNAKSAYDLRTFLKAKTFRQQQEEEQQQQNQPYVPELIEHANSEVQVEHYSPKKAASWINTNTSTNSGSGCESVSKNLEDLDYSLPITQPINISNEIFMSKRNHGNYAQRNNGMNGGGKRPFLANKGSNYCSDANFSPITHVTRVRNDKSDSNQSQEETAAKEGEENAATDHDDENNDESDDDDDAYDLTYKKMRSVVAKAFISNDKRIY